MAEHTLSKPVPEVQASPFQFQGHAVRTRLGGESFWFAAKDVCAALGIGWRGDTLANIPQGWQGVRKFRTPSGNQHLRVISEPAVYKLAFRSNKPQADEFTNWVASEVLPSIRKTGRYAIEPAALAPFLQVKVLPRARREQLAELLLAKLTHVPAALAWKARMSVWMAFNRNFSIPQYRLLPESRMDEAVAFLSALTIGPTGKVVHKNRQASLPTDDMRQVASALTHLIAQAKTLLPLLQTATPEVCA